MDNSHKNWSSQIREVLNSLHHLDEESEGERNKTASELFEEGYRTNDDALMSLSMYYLNRDQSDDGDFRRFLRSQVRDDVTGLLTMRPFLSRADDINAARAEAETYVLLFYNILNFSEYNNQKGINAGDDLLRRIGAILKETFPDGMIGHFDVDHYLVLIKDRNDLAGRVENSYEKISEALSLRNILDCRIGGYRWRDKNVKAETACSYAKRACDSLHNISAGHFIYYSEQLKKRDELEEYVLANIDEAIEKGWIEVFYQPIIRTVTGQLCSFEALSRWNDPVYGMMAPIQFIEPLAKSGLIWKLDRYVLHEIARRYADCVEKGRPAVPVSFNLDRQDFFAMDIFLEVENTVRKYQMPRDYLQIEVTERVFARNDAVIDTALKRFRKAGYAIWIDDFGSGYSTFNLLKDYDYDMLKIDMAFMLSNTERSRSVVQAIVEMNDRLGGASLCEGVETEEQYEYLRSIGCDMVQGYYFSAPKPYEELMALMKEKGITAETRSDRYYYDAINALSFDVNRPSAIFETDGRQYRFIYATDAFRKETGWQKLPDEMKEAGSACRKIIQASLRNADKAPFQYIYDDQLLEIRTRLLNKREKKYLLSAEVHNITAHDNISGFEKKAVYHNVMRLFDAVYLVNIGEDTIVRAADAADSSEPKEVIHGIDQALKYYSETWILPRDQAAYLNFFSQERIMAEVRGKHKNMFRSCFRTREMDDSYTWKSHVLVYLSGGAKPSFLYGVMSLQKEIKAIQKADSTESSKGNDTVELLRNIMIRSDLPCFLIDRSRRYRAVSLSYAALDNREETDLIGRTDEEVNWPMDLKGIEADVMHTGRHVAGLHRSAVLQGKTLEMTIYLQPIYLDGKIRGLIGCIDIPSMYHDDTDQGWAMIRALEAYDKAYTWKEKKYALVLARYEHAFDEKQAAMMKDAAEGYGVSGLISDHLFGVLMSYTKKEDVSELISRLPAGNQVEVIDGSAMNEGGSTAAEKMICGIAARPENDLQEDERHLRRMVSALMDRSIIATYIVSPDRTILYWNEAAEKITGYQRAYMVGHRCHETSLNHIDEKGCNLCQGDCPFLKVLRTNRSSFKDIYLHKKDGSLLKVRAFFTPLSAEDGTVLEVMEQFYPLEEEKEGSQK
jgi:PAS domain S-box-containing protein